jgi:hypothetical protein
MLWVFLGSAIFIYLHLFIPPFTPIWTGGDSMIWLHDAQRMLYGEALYRDFVQITLPATDILYFTMFKIFGLHMWIPNLMLILAGSILACLSYHLARSVGLGKLALLPSLLFITLIYRERLDATHHWYSTLAVLAALAIAINRRDPLRVAIAGGLCGLAATFTQTAGCAALFAFTIFLCWERSKSKTAVRPLLGNLAILMSSFLLVVGTVCAYLVWQASVARFVYCTLIFNLRYYGGLGTWGGYMIGLPSFWHWRQVPGLMGFVMVHSVLPLAYVFFFLRYRRCSPQIPEAQWNRLMMLALVGLALLLSVAGAPTWARLFYASLPAVILFVWFLTFPGTLRRLTGNALMILAAGLALVLPIAKQMHHPEFLALPAGRAAFLNQIAFDRYAWLASHTRSGDYFFGGFYADFYFPMALRNPAPVPFVTATEYTRPEEVQETIAGLEKHRVNAVFWATALDLPDDPQRDHLAPLRAYLRANYHVAKDFPEFATWIRND